jgi:hypothetical protein
MSCWTASDETMNKKYTSNYSKKNGNEFSKVNAYLLRSDFILRNFYTKNKIKSFIYITNYQNLSCWYLNIFSIDTSIVRVDVDEGDGIDNKVTNVD